MDASYRTKETARNLNAIRTPLLSSDVRVNAYSVKRRVDGLHRRCAGTTATTPSAGSAARTHARSIHTNSPKPERPVIFLACTTFASICIHLVHQLSVTEFRAADVAAETSPRSVPIMPGRLVVVGGRVEID